jgi:peptidoglycan-associated lipoprotein
MKRNLKFLLPAVLSVMLAAGCAHKVVKEEMGEQAAPTEKKAEAVPEAKPAGESMTQQNLQGSEVKEGGKYASVPGAEGLTKEAEKEGLLYAVHFDFDKYNIRDEDKKVLDTDAKWLRANSNVKVRIEGYCDERGEAEYNLALGDKRARSVKKYLEDVGVSGAHLTTISYGFENPVDKGHTEEAWAKNRRAEFKIMK